MSQPAFEKLRRFLEYDMRMSHLYQPLMLKTLLNGKALVLEAALFPTSHWRMGHRAEIERADRPSS